MKLQITIHVFGYGKDGTERHDEIWTVDTKDAGMDTEKGLNPLLLRADVYGETFCDILSLDRVEDGVAYYHPFATHRKLKFLERLPKFGWRKQE
jgi:hypothetical protein